MSVFAIVSTLARHLGRAMVLRDSHSVVYVGTRIPALRAYCGGVIRMEGAILMAEVERAERRLDRDRLSHQMAKVQNLARIDALRAASTCDIQRQIAELEALRASAFPRMHQYAAYDRLLQMTAHEPATSQAMNDQIPHLAMVNAAV